MCAELITARCRMDGRCVPRSDKPRPVIARLGFEPRLSDSESLVLPLHYQANGLCAEYTDRLSDIQVGFQSPTVESASRPQVRPALPVSLAASSASSTAPSMHSASALACIDWDARPTGFSTESLCGSLCCWAGPGWHGLASDAGVWRSCPASFPCIAEIDGQLVLSPVSPTVEPNWGLGCQDFSWDPSRRTWSIFRVKRQESPWSGGSDRTGDAGRIVGG